MELGEPQVEDLGRRGDEGLACSSASSETALGLQTMRNKSTARSMKDPEGKWQGTKEL